MSQETTLTNELLHILSGREGKKCKSYRPISVVGFFYFRIEYVMRKERVRNKKDLCTYIRETARENNVSRGLAVRASRMRIIFAQFLKDRDPEIKT